MSKKFWVTFVIAGVIACTAVVRHFQAAPLFGKQVAAANSNGNDSGNPFPISSPAYRETEKFHDWLLKNKKLRIASNSAGPIDRIPLSSQLATKGMARLPTDLLEAYMPLMEQVLDSMDDSACGSLLKGRMSLADLKPYAFPALASLNDGDIKKWFFVTESAIDAQLENRPVLVLAKDDAQQAILRIAASLPPDQSKLFLVKLAGLKTESDADVCAAVRTMFSQGALLPEPYRGYIARLLLSGNQGRGSA